ncbi:MAG TPA: hypothetical protein VLX68_05635 [Chitinivibrionales bacterium]|nr:hypothetical protein [Chitinivibrionales bacterium]
MPYCSRCGVEVGDSVRQCPLCQAPIQQLDAPEKPRERAYPPPRAPSDGPGGPWRILSWEIASAVCSAAVCSVGAIDLLKNGRFTWSVYPLWGIAVTWVYLTLAFFFIKRPWIALSGWIASTALFVYVLNTVTGTLDSFFPLGLPLTLEAGAAAALALVVFARIKPVTYLVGSVLAIIALLCVGLDYTIGGFLRQNKFGWSVIVVSAIVPLEGLLAFHRFFLSKRIDLKRLFHL